MTARSLPAVSPSYEMAGHERLGPALRRATLAEFGAAVRSLATDDVQLAVHEARKSMKRLRAMLRLVRDEIGDDVYRRENATLRDTARIIAPVRDGQVAVSVVRDLAARFDGQLAPRALSGLDQALSARREETVARLASSGSLRTVAFALRSGEGRYRAWPAETSVRHRFASVGTGIHRTYARGRSEMSTAISVPTAHNFHLWRKRVKYLRHQYEFLTPIWPEMMAVHVEELERLGDLLGEEHDLADLLRLLADQPWLCPNPAERALITALAQHRRAELRSGAIALGRRLYAERPSRVVDRLGSWWEAWDTATGPVGLDY